MGFLSEQLNNKITFKNIDFMLDLSFDVVLDINNLYKEDTLGEIEKLDIALKMLIINCEDINKLKIEEGSELLKLIFNTFINPDNKKSNNKEKLVDFEQDGEFIYSSFFMCYGIDLINQQGKLDWRKFIALFQGLSEKTKIKEIMSIRGRKIPIPTKYNQEEINSLRELKAYYFLENAEEDYQESLNKLFGTLEKMAIKS